MAVYYADPSYRAKLSEIQKNKLPPSETARLNMSKASKGKSKSPEAVKNMSLGMKKYYQNPNAIKKRSEQSKVTNARPEVKAKIKKALTGKKRSIETKDKIKKASIIRCQDEKYLEKQSISQSRRWANNPATWWNNGVTSKRSVESPGINWTLGRLNFGTWWTNGKTSKISKGCPGPEWLPGRKLK